jgi:hypothetical protein
MLDDEWAMAYPLSAKCFTRQRACEVLLDLLDKLQLPQEYVPTTYHWLLMYECLHLHIECLNDDPWPDFVDGLKASRVAQDAAYLDFPLDSQGRTGVSIDFESFIDVYFWDTDFLLDPSIFYQLGVPSRQRGQRVKTAIGLSSDADSGRGDVGARRGPCAMPPISLLNSLL